MRTTVEYIFVVQAAQRTARGRNESLTRIDIGTNGMGRLKTNKVAAPRVQIWVVTAVWGQCTLTTRYQNPA